MTSLLTFKIRSKGRASLPFDPHGFESFGDILRRLRNESEAQMTTEFSRPLSTKIDFYVAAELRNDEEQD